MSIYRKIYETNFGPIPTDEEGRTFDIYHIDGNNKNNSIDNLIALSIKDHYEIHYKQKDYGACKAISMRMSISPEEKSKITSLAVNALIEQGIHPWQDSKNATLQNLKRIKDGNHHFIGDTNPSVIMSKNGTHRFFNLEWQKQKTLKQIKEGKHPSQIKITCTYCNKTICKSVYTRCHGDKCKFNLDR